MRVRHSSQVGDLEKAANLDVARLRTSLGNVQAEANELQMKLVKADTSNQSLSRELAFAQNQTRAEADERKAAEARVASLEAELGSVRQGACGRALPVRWHGDSHQCTPKSQSCKMCATMASRSNWRRRRRRLACRSSCPKLMAC